MGKRRFADMSFACKIAHIQEAMTMAILEPFRYETEEILEIPIPSSGGDKCYVISGFADFSWGDSDESGGPIGAGPHGESHHDEEWKSWAVHLVVGREWLNIKAVSPTAGIAGYWFKDSDETDSTGIELENCRWDTVGMGDSSLERIRLKMRVRICGGIQSSISKISYHLVAIVTEVGAVG
jgi:hypothetical protein